MGKHLLVAGMVACAAIAVAQAKSYETVFTTPVQAGKIELQPGAYSIARRGGDAVFTNEASGRTYTVPVKVEYMASKNNIQDVAIGHRNGQAYIESIQLGGRRTTLDFVR